MPPPPRPAPLPAEPIRILFEDEHLFGIVKPAGLPTANAPRGAPSLFTRLQDRGAGSGFLGIVSRLDAPVSGVVVVAKTSAAAADLSRQFRERSVAKHYLAVVTGRFPAPLGTWVEWHDEIGEPAKAAHVRCRVVRRAGEVSLVELEPTTGRRHQLRIQLASRGCAIVGDRAYGSRLPCAAGGIALHAARLEFTHPDTGEPQMLFAECPDRWRAAFPSLFPRPSPDGRGR
jgi:23S rRNA pseudouridine1911/1915/1917 synthase